MLRLTIVLFPAGVIALGGAVVDGPNRWMFWVGTGLIGFLGFALLPQARLGQPATALAVIAEYVLAQVWLWFCHGDYRRDWFPHFAQGVLLIVPAVLFAAAALTRTGVHDLRRARLIIGHLQRRRRWPADRGLIQALPEVIALRDTLQTEAAPALALLHQAPVEMQIAALAALAFRKSWGPGQQELVLQTAQQATDPSIRVAAVTALVHCQDRFLLEALVGFMQDPAPEVRRAAAEAVFADAGRHWTTLRYAVHAALADPRFRNDGALALGSGELPPDVIVDLHAWAGEGGDLARRTTQTLVAYYGRLLNARSDVEVLAAELRRKLLDRGTASLLRVELAHVLHDQHLLDPSTLDQLLAADHPVALRLLSADALLADGVHSEAERTLREIARLPNREITLSVAQTVQRRLGVDLGLNLQKPPAVQSRQAAEIARRVMQWAVETSANGADQGSAVVAEIGDGARPRVAASGSEWDLGPFPDPPERPRGGASSGLANW